MYMYLKAEFKHIKNYQTFLLQIMENENGP